MRRVFPTTIQASHSARWARQWLRAPSLAIIGSYHGGNLGDCALGNTTASFASEFGVTADLQTIYTLDRWRPIPAAIVGGGAVAHQRPLRLLANRYAKSPERLSFVGVDFNDDATILGNRSFLRTVAGISCRSQNQAARLGELLGREDISHHFDVAFALPQSASPKSNHRSSRKVAGVNVAPFFHRKAGNAFVPGTNYDREVKERQPHLVPHIGALGKAYQDNVKAAVDALRARDYAVHHFPFTYNDDRLARQVLGDRVDRYLPYQSDPSVALSGIASSDCFLPTRFHALVFALLARVPVAPFAYAVKSEQLLDELQIDRKLQVRALDLLRARDTLSTAIEAPIKVESDKIKSARESAAQGVRRAYEAIGFTSSLLGTEAPR